MQQAHTRLRLRSSIAYCGAGTHIVLAVDGCLSPVGCFCAVCGYVVACVLIRQNRHQQHHRCQSRATSMLCLVLLTCRMDPEVWSTFLDWLSANGLLTTKAQSREAAGSTAAPTEGGEGATSFSSLEGMRLGDVGEQIPRDRIKAEDLATNAYLPQ